MRATDPGGIKPLAPNIVGWNQMSTVVEGPCRAIWREQCWLLLLLTLLELAGPLA